MPLIVLANLNGSAVVERQLYKNRENVFSSVHRQK